MRGEYHGDQGPGDKLFTLKQKVDMCGSTDVKGHLSFLYDLSFV